MIPLSRVSLVIAVYNQLLHTMQCLESILRLPDKVGELIVVDNASTDGTPEYLKGIDGITVIRNATNLGCAKAWNHGVQASKGDVIGILNNDIVVTSGWLPALLRFMEETGHGIISPAVREGPLDYELDKYAAEFTTACRTATRAGFLAPCMLVRRVVFDLIGLFDEGFIYGGCEDVDFLWRAKKAGITAAVTGSAFIHHFGMITQNAVKRTDTKAYPAQNMAHFRRKWGRTVRGNWLQRRWSRLKERWTERYERFRYNHTLVERG
jgi:N-acetylglucosaminyl-diphospho-decaprenol L-rhamnosyltransferase